MSDIKLKPCPFCGGDEEIRITKHGYFGVTCICGCTLFGFESSAEAANAWNTRVTKK